MLKASCGGKGELTVELLKQAKGGDLAAYDELNHQLCHQFSVGEVAYAAVPHLVELARIAEADVKVKPLAIVGAIAASRLVHKKTAPPLTDEWRDDYEKANEAALWLTAVALRERSSDPAESYELIATLAALQGHGDLAMFLFLGPHDDLSCPECGESITWTEQ